MNNGIPSLQDAAVKVLNVLVAVQASYLCEKSFFHPTPFHYQSEEK